MTELCELARKYGTDKVDYHHYTPFYHELFKDRRNDIRKVLEIGIGTEDDMGTGYKAGASLHMWEEYFPNAQIYGLDIVPEILINEGRISSFLCNQGSPSSLAKTIKLVGDSFDLIIDDGSHVPRHQILTLKHFFPLLNERGVYIIEDVWLIPEMLSQIPYKYELKEFNFQDDKLIVIKRADNL